MSVVLPEELAYDASADPAPARPNLKASLGLSTAMALVIGRGWA
jgi:hypothetical protein